MATKARMGHRRGKGSFRWATEYSPQLRSYEALGIEVYELGQGVRARIISVYIWCWGELPTARLLQKGED